MDTLETLLQQDLSLAMDLRGIRLIEASAGTGKTFTMAGLYARLVVEEGIKPGSILVMTFTRAACDELRSRLRQRLRLCAELADNATAAPDGPAPASDDAEVLDAETLRVLALLRRTRAKTGESADALRRRVGDAVNRMDEAVVVTINGFCQRVLREYAAQLDGGGQATQLEASDKDLLEDIAADLWLKVAGGRGPEWLAALQQLAASPKQLAYILAGLVYFHGTLEPARDIALPDAVDLDAAREDLLACWKETGEHACHTFAEWFEHGRLHRGQYKDGSAAQLRHLCAGLADGCMPADKVLAKYSLGKLQNAVSKDARDRHGTFPDIAALHAIDTWLDANRRAEQRRQSLSAVLLHELREQACQMLDQRKRELARMSYGDQIERLHHGLSVADGRQALIDALRAQFPYAMIDEFQDTNPRQFEIFRTLYQGFGSLLIIGDPKQAIYGFRGGDVHAYLQAAQLAAGRYSLRENFRSSTAMLEAIEALFTQRGAGVFVEPGIDFKPVACGCEPQGPLQLGNHAVPALTLWQTPAAALSKGQQRAAMAQAAAAQVANLLDPEHASLAGKPIKPGSIAVLVNKHTEIELLLTALRQYKIPAVSVQKQSVFGTEAASEVLRLLDALLAPESLRLARGALAVLLLGLSLADFIAMQDDEATACRQLERLAGLRRIWLRRGVLAMLERLLEQRASALLKLADGERRLSNLMQLAELLQDAAHGLSGPRALRNWLARHVRDADDGREEEQLRLESDAECVQLMTLHASKGLEFDLVLLPFMAIREIRPTKQGQLARFHRVDEAVKRLIVSGRDTRSDNDEAGLALARREQLAEDVRLLYVGVSRARHACWMSVEAAGYTPKKSHSTAISEYPGKVLHWVLGDASDGSALAQSLPQHVVCLDMPDISAAKPTRQAAPRLGPACTFKRKLRLDWWVHSFSQLNRGEREMHLDMPADHDQQTLAALAQTGVVEVIGRPRGAEYGNAVHAILEHADINAWRDTNTVPSGQMPLLLQHLRQAGYSGHELEQARDATAQLLLDSLNAPCLDAARLVDLPASARRAEMRFHFGMAGADPGTLLDLLHQHGYQRERRQLQSLRGQLRGLMHGIIDLLCLHEEQWWVMDYKTNHLGDAYADYDAAGMQVAVQLHSYDLQYLIYSVAVHRWLRQMLGESYDCARDFGGVRYLFLRGMHRDRPGMGVYADRPPPALIESLDRLLAAPGEQAA